MAAPAPTTGVTSEGATSSSDSRGLNSTLERLDGSKNPALVAPAAMTTKPPEKPVTRSVDDALAELLRAALLALPAELVEGGAREIVERDGKTLGYAVFEVPRLRVDIPNGDGKHMRIPVANMSDIRKAVTALMKVDALNARTTANAAN